jgi:hypothetical protein
VGLPVYLDGSLNPGSFTPASVALGWSLVSGPGSVTFTTADFENANARFTAPGVYQLRLTGTAPGSIVTTDDVTVIISESYADWATRLMASQSAANRLETADPDGDGYTNLAEYVLGGVPTSGGSPTAPNVSIVDGLLTMTWQRNLLAEPDIEIIPQLSEELEMWSSDPGALTVVLTGSSSTSQTWQATEGGTPGDRNRTFLRLLIRRP